MSTRTPEFNSPNYPTLQEMKQALVWDIPLFRIRPKLTPEEVGAAIDEELRCLRDEVEALKTKMEQLERKRDGLIALPEEIRDGCWIYGEIKVKL